MFISFNLNSSALKHSLWERKGLKIDIHLTSVLILLLVFANNLSPNPINSLIVVFQIFLAYLTQELFFIFQIIKDRNFLSTQRFCIYPFGLIHESRGQNDQYLKNKYKFLVVLMAIYVIYKIFLDVDRSTDLSVVNPVNSYNFLFDSHFSGALIFFMLINLLPIPSLPGMLILNKISSLESMQNIMKQKGYISSAFFIFALLVVVQFKSIYMSICLVTIGLLAIRDSFYSKTIAKAEAFKAKDFYAPLSSFVTLTQNLSSKNALLEILKHQQTTYPVFQEGELLGFLFKDHVISAIGNKNSTSVKDLISKDYIKIQEDQEITTIINDIIEKKVKIYAVYNAENLKGFLLPENLVEALLIREIIQKVDNQEDPFEDEIF